MISSVCEDTFHIVRSAYTAARIWDVTLQPSDLIPSPDDWECKYFKGQHMMLT